MNDDLFILEKMFEYEPVPVINSFSGEHRYLSNFPTYPFTDENGIEWKSSEHYYQANKSLSSEVRKKVREAKNAAEAKKLGKKITLRPDWESVKVDVMRKALFFKFSQNPNIKRKLLATGDAELIEGNTWGDTIWGQVNGKGQNLLGKLLMELRDKFRADARR